MASSENTSSPAPAAQEMGRFFDDYARDWDAYYRAQKSDGRTYEYHTRQRLACQQIEAHVPRGARLLEIGCGAGHTALDLVKRGFNVTCVDVSDGMLSSTRNTFAEAGHSVETLKGTVHDVPLERGPFDAVYALGVMEYVPDSAETIARMAQLLRPGGVCVLSFGNADSRFLRWEQPIKNSISWLRYLVTRHERSRYIATRRIGMHRAEEIRELFQRAGLAPEPIQFFGRGMRLGSYWFPPLSMVKRSDQKQGAATASIWGRGFLAVGTKGS